MRNSSTALVASLISLAAQAADSIDVVLTGDILLDRGVRRVIEHHGVDHLFSEGIDSVFRYAQVVVGNLECPATKIQAPVFKQFIFRAEPEWLLTLKEHGITHLNLANNHAIDQGREGLLDTRQNIHAAGMTAIGAGETMQEASTPVLLASEPRKVWLVPSLRLTLENFAYLPDKPCVSQEPMDSLLNRVHRLRQADSTAVIIVSLHWGGEHTLIPVPLQRHDAHMHRQLHLRPAKTSKYESLYRALACQERLHGNRDYPRGNTPMHTLFGKIMRGFCYFSEIYCKFAATFHY